MTEDHPENIAAKAWPFIKSLLELESIQFARDSNDPQQAGLIVKAALNLIDGVGKKLEAPATPIQKSFSVGKLST